MSIARLIYALFGLHGRAVASRHACRRGRDQGDGAAWDLDRAEEAGPAFERATGPQDHVSVDLAAVVTRRVNAGEAFVSRSRPASRSHAREGGQSSLLTRAPISPRPASASR